jgi:phage FluMu protein Com
MPETIKCVHCNATLRLPEQFIGKDVRCPSCRETFTAQLSSETAPPASHPEPGPEPEPREPRTASRRRPREDDDDRPSRGDRNDDEDDDDRDDDARPSRRPRRRRPSRSYPAGDRSGLVLALGIGSLVFVLITCGVAAAIPFVPVGIIGFIMGLVAMILGRGDLAAIRNGQRDPSGEGMTNAGFICGIIGMIINGLVVLLTCGCGLIALIMVGAGGMNVH